MVLFLVYCGWCILGSFQTFHIIFVVSEVTDIVTWVTMNVKVLCGLIISESSVGV